MQTLFLLIERLAQNYMGSHVDSFKVLFAGRCSCNPLLPIEEIETRGRQTDMKKSQPFQL